VTDYNFSRTVNAVPLVASEFAEAAAEYAIIFTGEPPALMPAVVLGARDNENLYLTPEGTWRARYVPAFIRRYPFVFSGGPETYTLCVDEAFQGLNYRGQGRPLFTEEGKPTPYVESVLGFLREYTTQAARTQAFCQKLVELKLLEPMQASFTLTAGATMSLKGFMAVDRKKLVGLSGEALVDLVKTDALELLYLHLQSMRNFSTVKDRLDQTEVSKVGADTGAEPFAEPAEE
jgi:hypothetical protein